MKKLYDNLLVKNTERYIRPSDKVRGARYFIDYKVLLASLFKKKCKSINKTPIIRMDVFKEKNNPV